MITTRPTNRWVNLASKRFLHLFTHLSGRPKRNSLSKRPGLLSAGSIESSRFVAPMTTTSPLESNPSISANRVDTMELWRQKTKKSVFFHTIFQSLFSNLQSFGVYGAYLCIWSWRLDLTGAKPSTSSKKMMDGRIWYACDQSNRNLIKINSVSLGHAVLLCYGYSVKTELFHWKHRYKMELPDQKAAVAVSLTRPPIYSDSQHLFSWRKRLFSPLDCTHWPKLWLQVFSLCLEDHKIDIPWRQRKTEKTFWLQGVRFIFFTNLSQI